MGLPMDDIHTPTVQSGPTSGPATARTTGDPAKSLSELVAEKARVEEELKAFVRTARARIIRLRNDYKALMSKIEDGLHSHHAQARNLAAAQSSFASGSRPAATTNSDQPGSSSLEAPFAKVNSVVAGSPAEEAGLKAGDKIRRFGNVDWINHEKLSKVAETVQRNEGVSPPLRQVKTNIHSDMEAGALAKYNRQGPTKLVALIQFGGTTTAADTKEELGW
ncbi:MAG: hypothetical protein Q9218_003862 [Villophora microphyllina]